MCVGNNSLSLYADVLFIALHIAMIKFLHLRYSSPFCVDCCLVDCLAIYLLCCHLALF